MSSVFEILKSLKSSFFIIAMQSFLENTIYQSLAKINAPGSFTSVFFESGCGKKRGLIVSKISTHLFQRFIAPFLGAELQQSKKEIENLKVGNLRKSHFPGGKFFAVYAKSTTLTYRRSLYSTCATSFIRPIWKKLERFRKLTSELVKQARNQFIKILHCLN